MKSNARPVLYKAHGEYKCHSLRFFPTLLTEMENEHIFNPRYATAPLRKPAGRHIHINEPVPTVF